VKVLGSEMCLEVS